MKCLKFTLYREKMWFEVRVVFCCLSGAMLMIGFSSDTWFGGNRMASPNEKKFVITDRLKTFSTVTVAGGCFWCMEQPYETLNGC